MDEPTASLDFGNQALVLREVRRLRERGFGIVLSTQTRIMPSPAPPRWPCCTAASSRLPGHPRPC